MLAAVIALLQGITGMLDLLINLLWLVDAVLWRFGGG